MAQLGRKGGDVDILQKLELPFFTGFAMQVGVSLHIRLFMTSLRFFYRVLFPFLILVLATNTNAHPAPDGFAELTRRLSPSVVNISTSQRVDSQMPRFPEGSALEKFNDSFGPDSQTQNSMGSGFVIDPKGIIVTNNHVIEDADIVEVTFTDGTTLEAEIVGRDPATDLAVLRVTPEAPLPAVSLGDSDAAQTGEWVLAIGNPFGLGGSVSAGIISAIDRDISSGRYDQFIQTDAAINRGNSGGPLFNMDGAVIGVNSAILSPSGGSVGIAFSIPSNLVTEIVDELLDKGHIERGWIGVSVQSVTRAVAESYGLSGAQGAIVFSVTEDGPADEAGLVAGDLIIEFDGEKISGSRNLTALAAKAKAGAEVDVLFIREGEPKTVTLKVAPLKTDRVEAVSDHPAQNGGKPDLLLGMELAEPTPALRRRYSIRSDVEGLVVIGLEEGSDAIGKIELGDVIERIAWKDVSTLAQAREQIEEATKNSGRPVLVILNRHGETLRKALRP
jgi:serine protease Do